MRVVAVAAAVAIAAGVIADIALETREGALEPAQRGATGQVSSVAAAPGLCLRDIPPSGSVARGGEAVPCSEPHATEVVSATRVRGEDWPGPEDVAATAGAFCSAQVARLVPRELAPRLAWRMWVPSRETWERGDRDALCVVTAEVPLVGSLERGDARIA